MESIEPPDQHEHCFARLGLAHAGAALEESDYRHCMDLPGCVLRTHCNVARGLFGVRPTATSMPEAGASTCSTAILSSHFIPQ
ncbi:WD repeat-containing 36-like protein [Labeo rohita]|uniref:WD repeat-containing 36-like protein n=1 Tax=Labeo rohita TaxID=84645 RepID=A0A498N1B4_LABRO|nr:WD repeat-containing 36-like protein [Labeo rohita]